MGSSEFVKLIRGNISPGRFLSDCGFGWYPSTTAQVCSMIRYLRGQIHESITESVLANLNPTPTARSTAVEVSEQGRARMLECVIFPPGTSFTQLSTILEEVFCIYCPTRPAHDTPFYPHHINAVPSYAMEECSTLGPRRAQTPSAPTPFHLLLSGSLTPLSIVKPSMAPFHMKELV